MTAEIIKFPCPTKAEVKKNKRTPGIKIRFDIPNIKGIPVKLPKDGFEYLSLCKQFLDPNEYKQVLCGVLDEEFYGTLRPELKNIVDYFRKLK